MVTELFASIELVTPPVATEIVPVLVIGPPVRPEPVATLVTVPAFPEMVIPVLAGVNVMFEPATRAGLEK
jgi:hypothetical protein